MVSVKDINNKRFDQSKAGYDPNAVDAFLMECSRSLKQAIEEKVELEGKMSVLADSIREFRKEEEDLKSAMIDIQRQKRMILAQTQEEAKKILSDAHEQAKSILGSTSVRLQSETAQYEILKKAVSEFKADILSKYRAHIALFTEIPSYEDEEADEAAQAEVSEEQTEEIVSKEPVTAAESFQEPQPEAVPPAPARSSFESKFGKLKFGQNV
ncbi:MAG: DivIVA domain-containing protein [Ruminococcus sp.]|jgi:cell division initiation protein|nr:DivIVA domain-containing protein [Ruminococcus sp.]